MNPGPKSGEGARVAVVVPAHWGWREGGSQQQARLLIGTLVREFGANVRYFAARTGDQTEYDDHDVVNVSTLDALHRYGHFWDYFSLQRELARFAPDVVYQRVYCAHTGIAARYASRTGTPLVWHISSDNSCRRESFRWRQLLIGNTGELGNGADFV